MCTDLELFAELRPAQIRGTQAVRLVMAEIVAGVRSVAEAKSRAVLRAGGVPEPEWNLDLFTEDGTFLATPDGWWPQHAVALEINSREWHLDPRGWALTQARWQRLTALGILVIPVTPGQIASDPAGFVQTVRDTLVAAGRRPLPTVVAVMRSQRAS